MGFLNYIIRIFFSYSRDPVGNEFRRLHRKHYYRNDYLQSDAWQRKRALVLKRDGFRCVHCGLPATQVHHKRYAKNIGREPIHWLESVCQPCHQAKHR